MRELLIRTGQRISSLWRARSLRQVTVAAVLSLLAVMLFGQRWLEAGVPVGDLPGAAAELARWQALVGQGALFSPWDGSTFFGHPRSLMNLYSGMVLAYLPFTLFLKPLMAVKVGSLCYLGLSGASAFVLMRYVIRHSGLALVLGMGYALHPIHLSVAISSSHANFPPYYFLAPLVVLCALKLLKTPSPRLLAATALLTAATAWVDLERLAVLMPGLAILAAGVWISGATSLWRSDRFNWRQEIKPLLAWSASLALTAMLLGFLLLPALAEQSIHAMFEEASRRSSFAFFSLENPFYYVDRAGQWLGSIYDQLPATKSHDAGTFYLGWTLMLLAAAGLVFAPRRRWHRVLLVSATLACAFSLAAAQGGVSGYQALTDIFDQILLYDRARRAAAIPLELGVLSLIGLGAGLVGLAWWRTRSHADNHNLLWVGLALPLAILLFAKPLPWGLAHLPLYGEMRNPGWFATAMPTLALMIAGGIGARALLRQASGGGAGMRGLIVVAVAAGLAWDVWPYRDGFESQAPRSVQMELAAIGRFLENSDKPGRVMTRESYNPRADLLALHTDRPTAFSWLNWMATQGASDLMLHSVYPNLHRPETIDAALKTAGAGHVRYVLYDLDEGPLPPPTEALKQRWKGEHFALYENMHCLPYVYLTGTPSLSRPGPSGGEGAAADSPSAASVDIHQAMPGRFVLAVEAPKNADLIIAESWAPGWSATVDGEPVTVAAARGAFLRLPVSAGSHRVQLSYGRHWSYAAGALVTGFSLLGILAVLIRPKILGQRWRSRWSPFHCGKEH